MGVIIVLIILSIIGLGIFFYNDMDEFVSMMIAVSCILGFIICLMFIPFRNCTYQKFKTNYDMVSELIEDMDSQDIKSAGLYLKILDINGEIATNKEYKDNFWIGNFFSDKIGDLELLKIKE